MKTNNPYEALDNHPIGDFFTALKPLILHFQNEVRCVFTACTTEVKDDEDCHFRMAIIEILYACAQTETDLSALFARQVSQKVWEYEQATSKLSPLQPGQMLHYLLKRNGLRQRALAEIAPQSVISEIIHGKRQMTDEQTGVLLRSSMCLNGYFIADDGVDCRRLAMHNDSKQILKAATMEQYFHWFDLLGVAVFAISGTLMAYRKHMDGFGVLVLASVTAIGGGTIRDLMLGLPVFWVHDQSFLIAILATAVATIIWLRFQDFIPRRTLLIADAIGLSFFVVMGTQKALEAGSSSLIAIVMGTITGSFGGLIRDVMCQETPLVLKGQLYATAAILGGVVYTQSLALGISIYPAMVAAMLVILLSRLAAIKWDLGFEVFKPHR